MLECRNVSKRYGTAEILKQVDLNVSKGQTLSVLGQSGCGKTTLLKILAGLEEPDDGSILLAARDVSRIAAQKRDIVYLHQEALLFPHLTVFQNVAFGLQVRKVKKKLIKENVDELLTKLKLQEHRHSRPDMLSGGQKQRVNFGRAIAINPKALLLDEPFANLDAGLRREMQHFYRELAMDFGITSVFVTHDLKEALTMGDHLAYMSAGILYTYTSHQEFIADQRTGVREEIDFWKTLNTKKDVDQIKL